ncbi:ribosomal protein S5 domain 2-type protein [Microdochium trichocladiopsis]|uniref:Galactokinase n=1 Tax=Microdochium trichocladiopsis TaxID=1682393 RepID=A0A9P8YBY9_9PEZI|nr:ribosomal protein S5 domain 2-type protein [Microdochium trichocladiopsis]KAH7035244.1 ribosomal protein S5 domain 2-type protein [Microdochium trichocladiopsis]
MSGPVPQTTALQDVYTAESLGEQGVRWNTLLEKFQETYGTSAEFVARSPGRVNIIGEHIDYSLYPCLPMAIYPDVIVAVSSTAASDEPASTTGTYKLQIANVASDRFPTREFDVPYGDVEIDATKHEWTNYFKAGLRGALELLRKKHGQDFKPRSMKVLMDGTVPAGGGLSSSAAFVSAAALAVMFANGERDIDKKALTEVAIVSERAVGVNSGGMDQSASVFSEMGSALLVSFSPSLSARPVFFPKTNPELCFLIAQSFVTSNKQVTGPIHYNLRVVEVSMAAAVLNAKFCPGTELPKDAGPLGVSLRGFHDNYFNAQQKDGGGNAKPLPEQLAELIEMTKSALDKEEGYTVADVAALTGTTVEDVKARFLSSFPVRGEFFKLRQRALHVFTEALRTQQFLALLEDTTQHPPAAAPSGGTDDSVAYNQRLGSLMNQTQDSCRDVYECSCPEIDQICGIIRGAGGYGSRLTGAGWGGCSVHLVPADKVEDIKKALVEQYYSKRTVSDKDMEGAIVVSRPMSGSAVVTLDGGRF